MIERSGKMGLEIMLTGDHVHHTALALVNDVRFVWDNESQTMTLYLNEYEAKDLYWDLLEIIPKLRHDRG